MKLVPGIGHVAGAIAQGASAGYFAHVVGRALVVYLDNGHDWGDGGLVAALDRIAANTDRRTLTRGLVDRIKARIKGGDVKARVRWVVASLSLALLAILAVPMSGFVRSLLMTRQAVATYVRLIAAANAQDLGAVRAECSARYLRDHDVIAAEGGGVVHLPRNIHKNFQAWREGSEVWLCPTDRQGPVYRFVAEGGAFRFDGPVGLLRAGRVLQAEGAEGLDRDAGENR